MEYSNKDKLDWTMVFIYELTTAVPTVRPAS